jgi:hypothetical protein
MKNTPNTVDCMYIKSVDLEDCEWNGIENFPVYHGHPGRVATVAYRVVDENNDGERKEVTFEINVAVQSKKDGFVKKLGRTIAVARLVNEKNKNFTFTVPNRKGAMAMLRRKIVNECPAIPESFRDEYDIYGEVM